MKSENGKKGKTEKNEKKIPMFNCIQWQRGERGKNPHFQQQKNPQKFKF